MNFRSGIFILVLFMGLPALAGQPNLVLLSVDTLRADFLGCYGCEWDISPHIDAFAETSLVFENAQCEMPLTAPSFSAMFTSRYPRMVGVTRNGLRLDDSVPVITERIRSVGYHTFAVQSNWTLKGKLCGLNRGFDVYNDDLEQRRWGFYKGERSAEDVAGVALELLEQRPPNKPFFAWIHFSDPHAPYHYHREYSPVKKNLYKMERREQARVKYASEVAYTDHYIGEVLKALPEHTIVLFAADHGESLYEHGYLGHGRDLYQPCMHVPMMIRAPGILPGRNHVPVGNMDVGPTLLGLLGIEKIPEMLGYNLVADSIPLDRVRFMETYGGAVPGLPGMKLLLEATSPLYQSVMCEGYKLVCPDDYSPALYFLPEDPEEKKNLAASNPDKLAALKTLLTSWDEHCGKGASTAADLLEEDREALKSLGYIK